MAINLEDIEKYEKILNGSEINPDELKNILSDIANTDAGLSYENQAKLRSLRERANQKLKELDATSRTTPESEAASSDAAPSSDITIEPNEAEQEKYNNLKSNQERREFVISEFNNGKFSAESHKDFYIEQLSKGEILFHEANREKLENLLGGEKGFFDLQENIARQTVERFSSDRQLSPGMATTGMVAAEQQLEVNDLGLKDAVKGIKKTRKKDDIDFLIREAQKAAIDRKFNGGDAYYSYRDALRQKKEQTSKWRFARRRKLEKALRDVDPKTYWATKKVNGGWLGQTTGYYGLRNYLANRKDKRFNKFKGKLERVTELKAVDASTKWMSKQFGKKLKTKWSLFWRRSPETLTKKLLKNATITGLDSYVKTLDQKLASLPRYADDRLRQQALDTRKQLLLSLKASCVDKKGNLAETRDGIIAQMGNDEIKNMAPQHKKFLNNLEARVALIKQNYNDTLANDPQFQVYLKLHNPAPENGKVNQEIITTEAVLQQICKDMGFKNIESMLKAQGIPDGEIEAVKKSLLPEKPKNEGAETDKEQTNSSEENTVQSSNVGRNDGGQARELELENYTRAEGEQAYKNENGDSVLFSVAEDKSRYDLVTKDKNEQNREPTNDEIKAMAAQLAKDGVKEVVLEDSFSPQAQANFLIHLENNNIAIKNLEEVKKRLSAERQEPVQSEEKTKGNDETSQTKTETNGSKEDKESSQEVWTAEKVIISAITKSKDEKEQIEKIKMIEQIQNGNFAMNGKDYIEFVGSIGKTFDKEEAEYLKNLAAAKSLEKDMKDEKSKDANADWIKEEKTAANVKTANQNQAADVSKIKEAAKKFSNQEKIDENDPAFRNLDKEAQKTIKTIVAARGKAKTPEEKQKAENQVIVRFLNAKHQRSVNRNSSKSKNNTRQRLNVQDKGRD